VSKKNILTAAKKRKADQLAIDNRLDEARVLYASVCQVDRSDIEALIKLGDINRRLGLYPESEQACRRAVTLKPNFALAHHFLGVSLHCQGAVGEALSSYRKAIELQPRLPDAHYLLGNALDGMGHIEEALASYRRAIALRPDYFEALSDLGAALTVLGEIEEASIILNRALSLRPNSPDALCNISNLFQAQGKTVEAGGILERAVKANPNSVAAIGMLSVFLERSGRLPEAKALTERGLALAPNDPRLVLVATRLARRDKRLKDAADLLESIRGHKNLKLVDSAEILISLGQLYDQLGDERAFPLLVAGNQQAAKASLLREEDKFLYLRRAEAMRRQLTDDLAQSISAAKHSDGKSPIFLVGFPRSGTTLLEQILDSHPALQTMEEKPTVAAMANQFHTLAGGRENALATLAETDIEQLRQVYFEQADQFVSRSPDTLLVDKMPLNTVSIPVIMRVFPQAKFILAIRHPCDVCLSCFMQNFAANAGMSSFYTLEDTVRFYVAVMGAWQAYEQALPIQYHRIRYEDLIADLENETRALLNFLGVGWDDAVMGHVEHAQSRSMIQTPSYHQVTQPIYQYAKYRWKRYAKEFEPFMADLRPFIEYFGYGETD
jgi:tetratricopeptide (TPR) repeat protein